MNESQQTEQHSHSSSQEARSERIQQLTSADDLDGALALCKESELILRESNRPIELMEILKSQGDLLREMDDCAESMRLLCEAENICRALGNLNRLQAVLNNQGLSLGGLGYPQEAELHFRESEELCRGLQDWEGVCRCLHNRAHSLGRRGEWEAALGLHQEEEQIWRKLENIDEIAECLGRQARIFNKLKNVDKALTLYKEQEQIYRTKSDLIGLQKSLGKRADILKGQNDLPAALALYREQEQVCRQRADREGLLWCLGTQLWIFSNLGDYPNALALCDEQELLCEELKLRDTLRLCFRNRAILLEELNKNKDALVFYRKEEAVCRETADLNGLADCLGNQAAILENEEHLEQAFAAYAEQEQIYKQLQDVNRLRKCLKQQAMLLKRRRDLLGALTLFRREEELCRQSGNREELHVCLGNQALVLEMEDNTEAALAVLNEKEQICRELDNASSLEWCLGRKGLILKRQGNFEGAMALFKSQELICRQTHSLSSLLYALGHQGMILTKRDDLVGALALYREQEQISRELLNNDALQRSLGDQALILGKQGDLIGALALHKEEERICRELGNSRDLQISLGNQALVLKRIGDGNGALELLREKADICRNLEKPIGVQWSLRQQAVILEESNHLSDALTVLKEEEEICRQLDRPILLKANLDSQSRIYQIQRDSRNPASDNSDSGRRNGPSNNIGSVTLPFQASPERFADRARSLRIAGVFLLALLIILPTLMAVLGLLSAALLLCIVWLFVDIIWRIWRWAWRQITAHHTRSVAGRLAHEVLSGRLVLSEASAQFTRCSLRFVKPGFVLRSLTQCADVHCKTAKESAAALLYCLALALADKRGDIEDRKKCRRLLVACLRASTVDANVRSECESLLQRDRDISPELFAASQIARAKTIEKPATVEECGRKIEALTPIESSLKLTDDLVQWIEAKNLLSLTYWTRWQISADPGDLENAIGYSQECLQAIQEKDRPADWASANYNLGVFYSVRKSADPHRDIELTIESMERALRGWDPGTPCYIDTQKRLMAALSRRSSGIESLNLDRGVNCINAAFADPTLTEPQRMSLEKSLNVLLNRRWGKAVSTLANEKHSDATKQFFDTPMEVELSELRGIVGDGEPFDKRRHILIRFWWVANIVGVGCVYTFWHQPWILMGALALLTAALVVTAAFAAPEGIQKAIRIPWEYLRVIPRLLWWMITSKDPNKPHKMRMMGQVVSFISNPESASIMAEEFWKAINREREPTVWAVAGSIYAWLSLQFPHGETGESIQNAITILQEAGDIFTSERFGSFQTGVDFLLAKAYLLRTEAREKESVDDAVDLLRKHLLPVRMIGSRRKSGILWGQALQLLGDAYMKRASSGQSQFLNEAIQCYVESIGKQPLLHRRPKGAVAVLASLARMRPTNAMRAHALQGIASALIRLSDEEEPDRCSFAIACLVNAYGNLNAPRFMGQVAGLVAQKEKPVLRSETLQAAEARLRIYILTARALTLSTSRSEPQSDLAEAMLRVCALSALRAGSNEIAYSALMDLGDLLSRQKRHEEAVGVYDIAIRHIEASRALAQVIERRAEIARYKTEPFDRIIVSLTHLGRISDAVGYVERGKSLGISDLVSLGGALRDSNRAPDLDEYSKLQVRATQLSHEITQRSQISGTTGTGTSIWTKHYINSNRQEFYRTAERLLQLAESASSSNIPPTVNVKTLGPSGIQQFGRVAKSAFVFFRMTDEATYAFIVTPGSVRAVRSDELRIGDLDKALGLCASSLPIKWWFRNDDPELFRVELNRLLNKLGDAVMRKISTVLREQQQKEGVQSFDRVVLFPSRTLSILPLHACWWNGNHGEECLLDQFLVSFAPSISIYRNCVETDRNIHQCARFVGIFDPLPPGNLHFASWERFQMETTVDGWDKRLLHREEATFTALEKANWLKSDILHFSCHGEYQLDRPFQSLLSLAGGDYLTLQYILEQVRLEETKLVVLSACESGIVDPRDAADEHYGLPTAFIFAGAPTVWATYWSVEDVATALLTVRAYENLRQGEVYKSEALRKAQLWLRRAPAGELVEILSKRAKEAGDDPPVQASIMKKRDELANGDLDRRPFSDPYYWGAFHTVGA